MVKVVEMDLPESDEENDQFKFWNNWLLSSKKDCSRNKNEEKFTSKISFQSATARSINYFPERTIFCNWIPPLSISNEDSQNARKVPDTKSKLHQLREKSLNVNMNDIFDEKILDEKRNFNSSLMKKERNLDWGKRVELHDVTEFNDGDLIWGVVNLEVFSNIKLWVNEYGNICGLAEGKISKLCSPEMSFIRITDTQLLKKMLNFSGPQWASLCETVQETKMSLMFDAFHNCDLANKTYLEKLWFFTCKRRHFFPGQCMLVKLSGGIKCMKKFQIIPKLIVQDIRTMLGELIL